ncbi:MAG: hypothetical protein AAF481_06290 [Acidobacteriota bacterium]
MMLNRTASVRLLVFAASLLVSVPAVADAPSTRALGADGTIYQIEQDYYGELFPPDPGFPPDNPALALRITYHDGSSKLVSIPGTAGPQLEHRARLIVANQVHVLWESQGATSRLYLASFDGDRWSDPVVLSGEFGVNRNSSELTVTRDSFEIDLQGEGAAAGTVHQRAVLHLVWSETRSTEEHAVHYAPVTLEDGAYIGEHPIFPLIDFLDEDRTASATAVSPKLLRIVTIRRGTADDSVAIGFVDPVTAQLISLDFRVLPSELSHLAAVVRQALVEIGGQLDMSQPGSLTTLIGGTRHHLIDIGARIQQDLLDSLADEVEAYVMATGCGAQCDLESLAQGAYRHLLEAAAVWTELEVLAMDGGTRHHLIDIGVRRETGDGGPRSVHLRLRPNAEQALPAGDIAATQALFLSQDGQNFLMAWEQQGVVFFRETEGADWQPTYSLGPAVVGGLRGAQELLEQRVSDR